MIILIVFFIIFLATCLRTEAVYKIRSLIAKELDESSKSIFINEFMDTFFDYSILALILYLCFWVISYFRN